jgi:hypothetical protein
MCCLVTIFLDDAQISTCLPLSQQHEPATNEIMDTGAYAKWISETGIMSILTPSGQKDAALQSVFCKAQQADEARQAAENISKMELQHNEEHNKECAQLVRG